MTLAETVRVGPRLAAKGALFAHPAWGGILGLNFLVMQTGGVYGPEVPGSSDWPPTPWPTSARSRPT